MDAAAESAQALEAFVAEKARLRREHPRYLFWEATLRCISRVGIAAATARATQKAPIANSLRSLSAGNWKRSPPFMMRAKSPWPSLAESPWCAAIFWRARPESETTPARPCEARSARRV